MAGGFWGCGLGGRGAKKGPRAVCGPVNLACITCRLRAGERRKLTAHPPPGQCFGQRSVFEVQGWEAGHTWLVLSTRCAPTSSAKTPNPKRNVTSSSRRRDTAEGEAGARIAVLGSQNLHLGAYPTAAIVYIAVCNDTNATPLQSLKQWR